MKTFVQPGEVLDVTVGATTTSGSGVLIGKRLGAACGDIANGATGSVRVKGVVTLPKLSTDVVAQGDLLYWDNTNKRLTTTVSTNTLAGYAADASGAGVATVDIALNA